MWTGIELGTYVGGFVKPHSVFSFPCELSFSSVQMHLNLDLISIPNFALKAN